MTLKDLIQSLSGISIPALIIQFLEKAGDIAPVQIIYGNASLCKMVRKETEELAGAPMELVFPELYSNLEDKYFQSGQKQQTLGPFCPVCIEHEDYIVVFQLLEGSIASLMFMRQDKKPKSQNAQTGSPTDADIPLPFETQIEEALKSGVFEVYLQPKAETVSRKIFGAEALVRAHTKDGRILCPSEFIRRLEDNHGIIYLDFYIFCQTCRLIREWGLHDFAISVNFSRITLSTPDFVEHLEQIRTDLGIPSSLLSLEIAETKEIISQSGMHSLLRRLHSLGYSIEIGGFGKEHSNIDVLTYPGVDVIKIDKALIDRLQKDEKMGILLTNICGTAHKLGIRCLAGGIETEDSLCQIRALGVDELQGNYIDEPMPAAKFYEKHIAGRARGDRASKEYQKIEDVFKTFVESTLVEHDVQKSLSVITDDVIVIGLGSQSIIAGRAELNRLLNSGRKGSGQRLSTVSYDKIQTRCYDKCFGCVCAIIKIRTTIGRKIVEDVVGQTMCVRKESGMWRGYAIQATSLFPHREATDLQSQAERDPITDVYNRSYSELKIEEKLKKIQPVSQGVFFLIGLDHFKDINDTYGFPEGNRVIREAAKCIRKMIRKDDIVGRLDVDEFCAFFHGSLTRDLITEKALLICEGIRAIFPPEHAGTSCRIGIVLCTSPNMTFEEVYQKAVRALCEQKQCGRSGYTIYTERR